jgi:hypothetical protein
MTAEYIDLFESMNAELVKEEQKRKIRIDTSLIKCSSWIQRLM